jgi:glutamyl-tRNA synthetase
MTVPVRVRFAPSPTGYLHVGGARTALFNYLFARHNNGVFILRIEDTDRSRYQADALDEIYRSLEWLGLDWDEGPGKGGDYGPYIQSERTGLYRDFADKLLDEGKAYRCFCTPERLAQVRLERENAKMTTGYDRCCRDLTAAQQRELLDKKTPCTVRFKIPLNRKVVFDDIIRGPIEYDSQVLDDLVLLKSDGFPTYHLANVVDDHCMKISHVLRGDEWIASTPRHILIYEAFGWEPPKFAHMPVILSPSGGKLSKRKGAASVMDYRQSGFLPEALFNFLTFLGWSPGEGDEREKMTRDELVKMFSIENITPKSAVFDEKKLEWMNGKYMEERPSTSIVNEVKSLMKDKSFLNGNNDNAYLETVIGLLKSRSKRITDIMDNGGYFFKDPVTYEEKAAGKYFNAQAAEILKGISGELSGLAAFDKTTTENIFKKFAETRNIPFGSIIHPARLAVSGVSFGPGLFELMEVLGKDAVVRRINAAIKVMC